MRTTALLCLALSLSSAGAAAGHPAEVSREEAVAAACAAVAGAPLRLQHLTETPLEFALLRLRLPYAEEPVTLAPRQSWFEVAALLRDKQAYWSARLAALEAPLPESGDLSDAFASARASLQTQAAASTIRLILADIEADRAVLKAPREEFSPQGLIDRKSALFKRLDGTRIAGSAAAAAPWTIVFRVAHTPGLMARRPGPSAP